MSNEISRMFNLITGRCKLQKLQACYHKFSLLSTKNRLEFGLKAILKVKMLNEKGRLVAESILSNDTGA
jgi:hypothetical protein